MISIGLDLMRASYKSHLLRHSGEPRIGSGAGAGMTTSTCFQEFCKRLRGYRENVERDYGSAAAGLAIKTMVFVAMSANLE